MRARLLDREELRQRRGDGERDEQEQVDRRHRCADDGPGRGDREQGDPEPERRCQRRQVVRSRRPPAKEETVVRSFDHEKAKTGVVRLLRM
jgi:hypothetical protein